MTLLAKGVINKMETEVNNGPIKVLAVVYQLNRGGLENRLMDILRNIDYSKVCIDIFTYRLEPGLMDDEARKLGSKIYYNKPLTIRNFLEYVHYFKNFLLKHPEYKIVHAHQDAWCSVFCKGAYLANIPVRIAHSRTALVNNSIENLIKNIIKLPARKYANYYFAVSDKAGVWLFGKKKYLEGKVQVWPNAIDCRKYRYLKSVRTEVRNELGLQNNFILMHVGNFTAPKNHYFLINVFERYHKKNPLSKLILVGGQGPDKEIELNTKKMVREKGLNEFVCFLGIRNDVPRLLQAADVFVFPSLFEGLPGAVVEAQASGLPCIISDRITKEVVLLKTTQQLPITNINEWCVALDQSRKVDRIDTFDEMQKAGFDIKALCSKLEDFYEKSLRSL